MQTKLCSVCLCRACGTPVDCPPEAPWPPGLRPCTNCGYLNLLDEDPTIYLLDDLSPAGLTLKHGATAAEIDAALDALTRQKLTLARARVAKDLPDATAFLLYCMHQREVYLIDFVKQQSSTAAHHPSVFNLATQLLYLLLCEQGGPDFRLLADYAPKRSDLYETLFPLLTDVSLIPRLRADVDAGYAAFAVEPPNLVLTRNANHTLIHEWQFNAKHWERDPGVGLVI